MENFNVTVPDQLDEIDRQLISILQQDGRASFAQIAGQLGVSAGMIRVRYNRLTDMGVSTCGGHYQPITDGLPNHGFDRN